VKLSARSVLTRVQSFIPEISGGIAVVLILVEVRVEHRGRALCAQAE
jgi:hypothetical protein